MTRYVMTPANRCVILLIFSMLVTAPNIGGVRAFEDRTQAIELAKTWLEGTRRSLKFPEITSNEHAASFAKLGEPGVMKHLLQAYPYASSEFQEWVDQVIRRTQAISAHAELDDDEWQMFQRIQTREHIRNHYGSYGVLRRFHEVFPADKAWPDVKQDFARFQYPRKSAELEKFPIRSIEPNVELVAFFKEFAAQSRQDYFASSAVINGNDERQRDYQLVLETDRQIIKVGETFLIRSRFVNNTDAVLKLQSYRQLESLGAGLDSPDLAVEIREPYHTILRYSLARCQVKSKLTITEAELKHRVSRFMDGADLSDQRKGVTKLTEQFRREYTVTTRIPATPPLVGSPELPANGSFDLPFGPLTEFSPRYPGKYRVKLLAALFVKALKTQDGKTVEIEHPSIALFSNVVEIDVKPASE